MTDAKDDDTPLQDWSSSSPHVQLATGTSDTYRANDFCSSPANVTEPGKFQDPGMLHTIRVTGLRPDTDYRYQVGVMVGQIVQWSDPLRIRSPLAIGTRSNFSYLVYGDQGCPRTGWGPGGALVNAMVAREITERGDYRKDHHAPDDDDDDTLSFGPIRAIHHFGDLSYARGAAHIWDEWFHMIESVTTRVPLMISVGNHEYDYTKMHTPGLDPSFDYNPDVDRGFAPKWGNMEDDSGGECGVVVAKRFTMPSTMANETTSAAPASNGVFWYSYDMGSVHTTVLSGEHDLSPGSPQHTWLEADLLAATARRGITPWLVVEVHRPMYNSQMYWEQNDVGIGMRMEFEDLLYDYSVDLYLAGHYHTYLRTCDGLFRSRCGQGGPTHITVGAAGAVFHTFDLYENDWTAAYIKGVYGYGRISIANASALHFEYVKAGPKDDPSSGDVVDDVWIYRDR